MPRIFSVSSLRPAFFSLSVLSVASARTLNQESTAWRMSTRSRKPEQWELLASKMGADRMLWMANRRRTCRTMRNVTTCTKLPGYKVGRDGHQSCDKLTQRSGFASSIWLQACKHAMHADAAQRLERYNGWLASQMHCAAQVQGWHMTGTTWSWPGQKAIQMQASHRQRCSCADRH